MRNGSSGTSTNAGSPVARYSSGCCPFRSTAGTTSAVQVLAVRDASALPGGGQRAAVPDGDAQPPRDRGGHHVRVRLLRGGPGAGQLGGGELLGAAVLDHPSGRRPPGDLGDVRGDVGDV